MMRFAFNADQIALAEGVRAVLDDRCPPSVVRSVWNEKPTEVGTTDVRTTDVKTTDERTTDGGTADAGAADDARKRLWRSLADLGLLGALVPESHGGLGLNELDILLGLTESGRAAAPIPLVEAAVVAARLLADSPHRERLADLAAGDLRVSSVLDGSGLMPWAGFCTWVLIDHQSAVYLLPMPGLAQPSTSATAPGSASTFVSGHTSGSATASGSASTLASGSTSGSGSASGSASTLGFALETVPTVDRARPLARLRGWPAAAEKYLVSADPVRIAWARQAGSLAVAAQLIGLGERMLAMTVDYVKQRHQFGVPIGSFQAVKHALADALLALELARPLVHAAAWSSVHDRGSAGRDVAAAKIRAGEAAGLVARTALQAHGGMGYTQEYDLHLWLKRTWALQSAWGHPHLLRAHFALQLANRGGL
jgi:alkylation response protein AidB-like acyl-CoA dehydrogenase